MTKQNEVPEVLAAIKPDLAEIERAIRVFGKELTEVRVPKTNHKGTMSGVFTDPSKLAAELFALSEIQKKDVYWTSQKIASTVPAHNRMRAHATDLTGNDEISDYLWLIADFDPVKKTVKDDSATDAEKAPTLEAATRFREWCVQRGIPTILVDSGNGYHVYIALSLPNTADAPTLVRGTLYAINEAFGVRDAVKIDTSVFNPARIIKVPGTISCKGPGTAERPHRVSRIVDAPEITERVDRAGLEELLDEITQLLPPEMQATLACSDYDRDEEDASGMRRAARMEKLKKFIEWGDFSYTSEEFLDGGRLHALIMYCPFNHASGSHSRDEALSGVSNNGALRFKCFHDSCQGRTWREFRALVESNRGEKFDWSDAPEGWYDDEPDAPWVVNFGDHTVSWDGQNNFTETKKNKDGSITTTIRARVGGESTTTTTLVDGSCITTTGVLKFKKPQVNGGPEDYVLGPRKCEFGPGDFSQKSVTYEGWFPRSSISLIGGSSGVGKTSWTVPLLVKQTAREAYAGHEAYGLDYILFLRDRGGFALERLLRRLGLDEGVRKNIVRVKGTGMQVIAQIVKAIESREKVPGVVFIDGLDMTVSDPNKMPIVMEFVDWLGEIAEHFHIAVIGAVGAPKRAKKDGGFTSQRDELYGSTAWGRAAETIVHATEGDDGNRIFTVMHRNSPKEIFHMRFNAEGRLEEYEPNTPEERAEASEATWFRERQQLAAVDAGMLYWSVTDLATGIHASGSTALRRIKEALAKGWVQEKPGRQKGHAVQFRVTEMFK